MRLVWLVFEAWVFGFLVLHIIYPLLAAFDIQAFGV